MFTKLWNENHFQNSQNDRYRNLLQQKRKNGLSSKFRQRVLNLVLELEGLET